jgi:hypothetical protein
VNTVLIVFIEVLLLEIVLRLSKSWLRGNSGSLCSMKFFTDEDISAVGVFTCLG